MEILMSTFKTTLVLGLLLLANACSVGTVTASSRMAGGGGSGFGGLGPNPEANSSAKVEAREVERVNVDRAVHATREPRSLREADCRQCR
jgi:hypothetical protein